MKKFTGGMRDQRCSCGCEPVPYGETVNLEVIRKVSDGGFRDSMGSEIDYSVYIVKCPACGGGVEFYDI